MIRQILHALHPAFKFEAASSTPPLADSRSLRARNKSETGHSLYGSGSGWKSRRSRKDVESSENRQRNCLGTGCHVLFGLERAALGQWAVGKPGAAIVGQTMLICAASWKVAALAEATGAPIASPFRLEKIPQQALLQELDRQPRPVTAAAAPCNANSTKPTARPVLESYANSGDPISRAPGDKLLEIAVLPVGSNPCRSNLPPIRWLQRLSCPALGATLSKLRHPQAECGPASTAGLTSFQPCLLAVWF